MGIFIAILKNMSFKNTGDSVILSTAFSSTEAYGRFCHKAISSVRGLRTEKTGLAKPVLSFFRRKRASS